MTTLFTESKRKILVAYLATIDARVALLMSNNTVAANEDADTLSALTLDECDASNYVRKALVNEAVTEDNANDRAELGADNLVWTGLGNPTASTRTIAGLLLYEHVTNDADSVPIAFIDTGGFPFTADGEDVTIAWNVADGILALT